MEKNQAKGTAVSAVSFNAAKVEPYLAGFKVSIDQIYAYIKKTAAKVLKCNESEIRANCTIVTDKSGNVPIHNNKAERTILASYFNETNVKFMPAGSILSFQVDVPEKYVRTKREENDGDELIECLNTKTITCSEFNDLCRMWSTRDPKKKNDENNIGTFEMRQDRNGRVVGTIFLDPEKVLRSMFDADGTLYGKEFLPENHGKIKKMNLTYLVITGGEGTVARQIIVMKTTSDISSELEPSYNAKKISIAAGYGYNRNNDRHQNYDSTSGNGVSSIELE